MNISVIFGKESGFVLNGVSLKSVQFSRSIMSDSLRPHGLQHTRPPCPSPTPCFLFYLGCGQVGNIQRRLLILGWVVGTPSSSLGREGQGIEMGTEVCYQPWPLPVGTGLCPEGGKPGCVSKYRSWCEHSSHVFMFIRTGSVFNSMKIFREEYENNTKCRIFYFVATKI